MGIDTINRSLRDVSYKSTLIIIGILGTLVLFVLAWVYPTFPGDDEAIARFQALRSNWLDDAAVGFDNLKMVWVYLLVVVVLSGGLIFARRYADVAVVLASLPVVGIGYGIKLLIDRPRPEFQMLGPIQSDPSFPSGHALLAVIIGGILVYFVERSVNPWAMRRAIQIGLILAVLSMGASRIYMGVHWPSYVRPLTQSVA